MNVVMNIRLLEGWLPSLLAALLLAGLSSLVVLPRRRPGTGSHAVASPVLVMVAAGAAGYALVWFLSDVVMAFGVSVGWMVMTVVAAAFSLVAFLIVMVVRSSSARRITAIVLIPLTIVVCATSVNMVYGEYTTVGSIIGQDPYPPLSDVTVKRPVMSVRRWRSLASRGGIATDLPSHGIVRTADIPATRSGFAARSATVYLPPAALSSTPPRLPVMVLMSGQPGSPTRLMSAGDIPAIMDEYAARHHGLAPIVVSPDQNGSFEHNSLCADTSVYGRAETYLVKDVPRWIRSTLPASSDASQWLIGGFSQGGTCSVQLGPAHPELFGSIFAAATEFEPTNGSRSKTIAKFFDGDAESYDAHIPTTIIARHSPSSQTLMMIAGEWDKDAQDNQRRIAAVARSAGMRVTVMVSRASGHDWHTVRNGLAPVLESFGARTGLGKATTSIRSDPRIVLVPGFGQ